MSNFYSFYFLLDDVSYCIKYFNTVRLVTSTIIISKTTFIHTISKFDFLTLPHASGYRYKKTPGGT